ncbi:MAG: hypothetical protein GQ564_14945 [Bacteroidales bacterium]|nr:hypothetical protein [Bacteroidales bacterium]
MKDLKNLNGATQISKKDQKNINGGAIPHNCFTDADCERPDVNYVCIQNHCLYYF